MRYWFYTRYPLPVVLFENMYRISTAPWLDVLSKNENIFNVGYWFPASRGLSFFLSFLPRRERPLLAGKVLGVFWKAKKLILIEKNQCVLIPKISFRKTEKSPIRKNKLPQKFSATRYTHLACFVSTINNIGIINHLFIVTVQTV